MYNLFVRALEPSRRANFVKKKIILACFAANTNEFYFYRHCTYIMFILQCQKVQNWKFLPNRAATSAVPVVCNVALYCCRCVPFAPHLSESGASYLYAGRIKQSFIRIPLLYSTLIVIAR